MSFPAQAQRDIVETNARGYFHSADLQSRFHVIESVAHHGIEKTLLALLVLSPCALAQSSAATPAVPPTQMTEGINTDMFLGTWKENRAKSIYKANLVSAGPIILKIAAVPNGLKVVSDDVIEQIHEEYTVKFDGRDYPYQRTTTRQVVESSDPIFVVSAKKIDAYAFEIDFKEPGKVFDSSKVQKHVLSKDGLTQTVTMTDNYAGRAVEDIIVFDKQ